MPLDADDMRAADELNQRWDALNLDISADDSQGETVLLDRLSACDDAPLPSDAFLHDVRATLMARPQAVGASSRHALGIVKPAVGPWPFVSVRRIAIAAAMAACLTFILSMGGGFLRDQANAPTVASVLASPAMTPTTGPTSTAPLDSTDAFTLDHEVSLLPEIAATATGETRSLVAPATSLTVLDTGRDTSGQPWLLVKTGDGQVGWLRDVLTIAGQ
jgi:hypothetical protein